MALNLTPEQITAIVESWEFPAKNIFDSGDLILYKYFVKFPQYKQFFKKFKNVPLEQLKVIKSYLLAKSSVQVSLEKKSEKPLVTE